jgi:REP element-mobilizing transposase RayT
MYESNHAQFFTATINQWKHLLKEDKVKNIITDSLNFLTEKEKISLNAFVIMDNHLHLIWRIKNPYTIEGIKRDFLKFTAQQIKSYHIKNKSNIIEECKVNHYDRQYKIWQSNSLSVDLYSQEVYQQKLDYIHNNPVRAGLCKLPEDYKYSSASYYVLS